MVIENVVISAIKHLGNLRFDIDKISELTQIPREKVSKCLAKMATKKMIERVIRGVYINKSIDLTKVDIPNTIEVRPSFLKFNGWKTRDLKDLGFTLNYIKISGLGGGGEFKSINIPTQIEIPFGDRKKSFTLYRKISNYMNATIIQGFEHDGVVPGLVARFPTFIFKITFMSITSMDSGDVIILRRNEDRFMIHSINETTFKSHLFDMDYVAKILGDLFYATCSLNPGVHKKATVCHPMV